MVWSNQASTYLIFPPGATSGERLVIDESGIKAYDANGNLYIDIDANNPLNFKITMPPGYTPNGQRIEIAPAGINGYNSTNDNILQIESGVSGQLGAQILNLLNATGSHTSASIQGGTYVTDGAGFTISGGGGILVIGGSGDEVQITSGIPGGYYSEEYSLTGTVPNSSTFTPALARTHANTDYAEGIIAGVWTCPIAGWYKHCVNLVFTSAFSATRAITETTGKTFGITKADGISNANPLTVSNYHYYALGATATIGVFQNSGSNQVINNTESYWSIRREL